MFELVFPFRLLLSLPSLQSTTSTSSSSSTVTAPSSDSSFLAVSFGFSLFSSFSSYASQQTIQHPERDIVSAGCRTSTEDNAETRSSSSFSHLRGVWRQEAVIDDDGEDTF